MPHIDDDDRKDRIEYVRRIQRLRAHGLAIGRLLATAKRSAMMAQASAAQAAALAGQVQAGIDQALAEEARYQTAEMQAPRRRAKKSARRKR